MHIRRKPGWYLPERVAAPQSVFESRRRFISRAAGLTVAGGLASPGRQAAAGADATLDLYPAERNQDFVLDRPLTTAEVAAGYNNFYEFGPTKLVGLLSKRLETRPWQISVGGLVKRPRTYDIDSLIRGMKLEERLYRLRCVEAWAIAVPWTGFPLADLIRQVEPKSDARYVVFSTFMDKSVAPRQLNAFYPWPYTEVLTVEEAANELTILATGVYGKPLPKQHGAPLRLVVPWKYGFKSIKSIVSIEFTKERPKTFWEALSPTEYGFWANVNPKVPHPEWSQSEERMLGTKVVHKTALFNGYGEWVAHLYPDLDDPQYFR